MMMETPNLAAHALSLVLALACTAAAQLLAVRVSNGRIGVVMSLFIGFLVGLCVLGVSEVLVGRWAGGLRADHVAMASANFVLFVCCWYFYFHFVNIGEASLRIRVLREAARFSGSPLEDLLAVYNVRAVVATRLERLVEDGQLVVADDRFCAGKQRMVLVAKTFALLRWLLLGQTAQMAREQ
jgi:hypothetical protein